MSKKKGNDGLQTRKGEEESPLLRNGLPAEAFAIVGDPQDASTWQLPHHTRAIIRCLEGEQDVQSTVHWPIMPATVALMSPAGFQGMCIRVSPEARLAAAHHLAGHYKAANMPLPNALAVLV